MLSLNSLEALPFIHKLPLQSKEKNVVGVATVFIIAFTLSTLAALIIIKNTIIEEPTTTSVNRDTTTLPQIEYDSITLQSFKEASQHLLTQGKLYEAGDYLERILIQDNSDTFALRAMINTLTKLNKKDDARLFLKKLQQLEPENCNNLKLEITLLTSKEVLKKHNEGYYTNCLSTPGLSNLIAKKILGEAPEESKLLLKAERDENADIFLLEAKQLLADSMAYTPTIEKLLLKATQESPLNYEGHLLLGQIYLLEKNNTAALKELQIAHRLSPNNHNICYHLGLFYFRHDNQPHKAAEFFEKALQLNPSHWESSLQMGLIFQKKGKSEGAIHYFKRSLNYKPHNTRILLQLGAAYERSNQKEEAIEIYERILGIDNQNDIALFKIKILKKD